MGHGRVRGDLDEGNTLKEGRVIPRVGEAIVLRTWPFQEADLLVSLFTREHGRVKGVARHAMRSRRRFGGALEADDACAGELGGAGQSRSWCGWMRLRL